MVTILKKNSPYIKISTMQMKDTNINQTKLPPYWSPLIVSSFASNANLPRLPQFFTWLILKSPLLLRLEINFSKKPFLSLHYTAPRLGMVPSCIHIPFILRIISLDCNRQFQKEKFCEGPFLGPHCSPSAFPLDI